MVDDSVLVEQAAQGNVGAYEELVRRYQDVALRTAYLITGGAPEAEDAAQDAFVKAYYALERFRAGAPFRPWLLRIVANEAHNRCKAAERRGRLSLRAVTAVPPADAPSPEALVLTGERRTLLLHALDGLREDDRLVIAYRYFYDLSEEEMAAALDCARGTVKSRLARALQRLREGIGAVDGAGRADDD